MSHPEWASIGTPETRTIEECSELIQALCKAQRFGWFNFHPDFPDRTNLSDVMGEMDDVVEAIEKLEVHLRQIRFEHYKGGSK